MNLLRTTMALACVLIFTFPSFAQKEIYKPAGIKKAVHFRKTIPLRDMQVILPGERDRSWKDGIIRNEVNTFIGDGSVENALPIGADPVLQDYVGEISSKGPLLNFDGVGNVSGVYPPDTDGDVGPDHYFQMINLAFAIWDKAGNKLYGPVDNSTLWQGFVGPWTGTNDGDPIVLYDEEADRWMASQFAINTSNGTYWQLIAVSETGDPLGAYFQYAFEFPGFNDYPKMGVWPDGYYASFNIFSQDYNRAAISAFERDKMLVGDSTARMILFDMPEGSAVWNCLPTDFDGPPPPDGTPNYFAFFKDDEWGFPTDQLQIWEFVSDWDNPINSTFSEAHILETAPFTAKLCDAPRWQCIPQPNTTTQLEALNDRLMFRLQYRNWNTYATMVVNHTVNADGNGRAGIRWYELRDQFDGNGWSIYQQGTYSPDDNSRWMGSIAMNGEGTIAIGFTISSDTINPSIRYVGRSKNAPLGEMDYNEIEVITGIGSQGGYARWGDYSCLSIDPVDDKTFWHTNEYSIGGWRTRIFSFDFGPIPDPILDIGPNDTICDAVVFYRDPYAEYYKDASWTTTGDGIIQNPRSLNLAYLRGTQDVINGSVKLYCTVKGYLLGQKASDSITVYIDSLPIAHAGNDTMICNYNALQLHGWADNYTKVKWSTSGDGTFDDATSINPVYTPGIADTSAGSIELLLKAISLHCEDTATSLMILTFDPCFGIDERSDAKYDVLVYPNPNNGVFDLEINGDIKSITEISVLSMDGRFLFSQTIDNITAGFKKSFDLHLLNKGTYYLRIQNAEFVKTLPVIIK